ncbi:unnamed protein product [Adineta ricciae]|uniref:Uncharacterized protein n=1 Tax=Adineta ricciae TaxID=249248 RepID=A0A813VTS2_ADIRI|nr:unnamed protein product [Adineta ricciae]
MLGCCIPRDPSKHTNKIINEALERERKELNAESKLLLLARKDLEKVNIHTRGRIRKEHSGEANEDYL